MQSYAACAAVCTIRKRKRPLRGVSVSGGEGGIHSAHPCASPAGRPRSLTRRGRADRHPCRSVEPTRHVGSHAHPRARKPKRPLRGVSVFWRRGWDSLGTSLCLARWAPSLAHATRACRSASLPICRTHAPRGFSCPPSGPKTKTPLAGRFSFLAERVGFEPTYTREDVTGIPVQRLRPLGHLSAGGAETTR